MKTLVIKTGSLGDVVRTTVVLEHLLEDEVHWVTGNGAAELLPEKKVSKIYDYKSPTPLLFSTKFDRIFSLEESADCLKILHKVRAKQVIGVYSNLNVSKILYFGPSGNNSDLIISRLVTGNSSLNFI